MQYPVATTIQELNTQQRAFVESFIEHGDARRAAKDAGYKETVIRTADLQMLGAPRVAFAITMAARSRLARAAPMALNTLEYLAEKAVSEKVRLDASKAILDRAGLVPPAPPKEDPNMVEKPLHEMSTEELRALANKLENEIVGRATPVESLRHDDKPLGNDISADVAELVG
jgi:phage terminase small subunit